MPIAAITLVEILTNERWAKCWYWATGSLELAANNKLYEPGTNPHFTLAGTIIKESWDEGWRRTRPIKLSFSNIDELAMSLSTLELVNSDQVIYSVKHAINSLIGLL